MTKFEDLYKPLWCYSKGVSEAFTELLDFLQTNYGIEVSFETDKDDECRYFYGSYNFESKRLNLVPNSFNYYFSIHELFHFLVSSKEEKKMENWGMPFKQVASSTSDSHLLNEIKTAFAASAYINKHMLELPARVGLLHIIAINYSNVLISINSFGSYRVYNEIAPNVSALKTSEEVAMALKDSWYRISKTSPKNYNVVEYSEPSWKDWLRVAKLQEVAIEELIRDNFLDKDCLIKPMTEWNLKLS